MRDKKTVEIGTTPKMTGTSTSGLCEREKGLVGCIGDIGGTRQPGAASQKPRESTYQRDNPAVRPISMQAT